MKSSVLVTVVCVTYNHIKYLSRCLEGILMQKVNFRYEIIVHDDASSDGTKELLEKYALNYPDKIVPIFETENLFTKNRSVLFEKVFPLIKGKYVAFCDGDDYWTDPLKLSKQIKFLELNRDYNICFHPVKIHMENSNSPEELFPTSYTRFNKNVLDINYLFLRNFIPTCSVVYRWINLKDLTQKDLPIGIIPEDWYIHLLHAKSGKIFCMNEVMAIYWRHESSVWYGAEHDDNWYANYLLKLIKFYEEAQSHFNFDYSLSISYLALTGIIKAKAMNNLFLQKSLDLKNISYNNKFKCFIMLNLYKILSLVSFGYLHEKFRYKRTLLKKILSIL